VDKDVALVFTCKRPTGSLETGRVYRVDIDFKNAFNAMSPAALWQVMRMFKISDVDLLEHI